MKLLGTMIEDEFRQQLLKGRDNLLTDQRYKSLFNELTKKYPDFKAVFFLEHIIEEEEDIFDLLIDGLCVVRVEVSRIQDLISWSEPISLFHYEKKIVSKQRKIKLAVALDLSKTR